MTPARLLRAIVGQLPRHLASLEAPVAGNEFDESLLLTLVQALHGELFGAIDAPTQSELWNAAEAVWLDAVLCQLPRLTRSPSAVACLFLVFFFLARLIVSRAAQKCNSSAGR